MHCDTLVVDTDRMLKLGINGRYVSAAHAILDGETNLSCPFAASRSAGLDAMVHTLESFAAKRANAERQPRPTRSSPPRAEKNTRRAQENGRPSNRKKAGRRKPGRKRR